MSNMFKCVLQSGGSGIPLVVTCASAFAGLTITCSDGTTTLTDTCPSSSPYEITFNLPNTGTWTVSGTISGTTYSESIVISDSEIELKNNVDITIDVYGAASDTISYTGLDSQTHTISTDTDGHATATITVNPSGSTITFTSSVAKDSSNLSNAYTKSITLTSATTAIYVCPEGAIYWYGYKKIAMSAQPYRVNGLNNAQSPSVTYNTNNVSINETHPSGSTSNRGVWIADSAVDISTYSSLNVITHDCIIGNTAGTFAQTCGLTATHADSYTRLFSLTCTNTTATPQYFTTAIDTASGNSLYPETGMLAKEKNAQVIIDAWWFE